VLFPQRRFSIKPQASLEILEQHIPTDVERPSQSNQNGKGAAKVPSFEHLQITGSDAGLFGQSFLGQTGGSPQPAQIASKNLELFLWDALHE
jgi:hypothetical protein